jgi:vacuolar-type H+-ATPase subunit D/Vma8
MKLIKTWEELAGLESENYRVEVDLDKCSGWIVPKVETKETEENYFKYHWYLSTHTFYGHSYAQYTELFQKLGFDIELDNWDKEEQEI